MPYTYDEIDRAWQLAESTPVPPEELVAIFDRCERMLGRQWTDQARGRMVGPGAVFKIIAIGQRLVFIDGLPKSEELIKKLRLNDPSAHAELHAIALVGRSGNVEFDLFPEVMVGTRRRVPDFRARSGQGLWVCVEVTRPDMSEVALRAQEITSTLAGVVQRIDRSIALEVFLRREPDEAEIAGIGEQLLTFSTLEARRDELPGDLGFLFRSEHAPGVVSVTDHPGEVISPRVGTAKLIGGGNEPTRHVQVRMPFSDQRADRFIAEEAKQLPDDSPGLIMVDLTNVLSGFKAWEPLIRRRFQPTMNRKIGGVCLFSSGTTTTGVGLSWFSETNMLVNPHAGIGLPAWLTVTLAATA